MDRQKRLLTEDMPLKEAVSDGSFSPTLTGLIEHAGPGGVVLDAVQHTSSNLIVKRSILFL